MKDLELEKEHLSKTIEIIKDVLDTEEEELIKLFEEFIGEREELWRIADRKKIYISNLKVSKDKPYFARIDFTSDDDHKTSTIYIGKNGVTKSNEVVVTDWRAPISSLYYDSELGTCSYLSPSGEITGSMDLKRQFEIDKGKLLEYFDVDLVSNDALLQKYLNANNDSRLKSIVSTIQKEQNDVIRRPMNLNLIIQGVAGSGKTTVALHRIAYLVYNYINQIKQNQYLVIGPNPVFLKYIKSVLPELDVTGVNQYTFEGFAKVFLNEDITINDTEYKIVDNINKRNVTDIDKFKCSMKYKEMLDLFIKDYVKEVMSKPLLIGDFKVLDSNTIMNIFNKTNPNISFEARISQTIDEIVIYIRNHQDTISTNYINYTYTLFKNASDDEKEKLKSKFAKDRKEIQNNCKSTINKYFSKIKIDPTKIYLSFLSNIESYDIYNYKYLSELKKNGMKNIRKKSCDFEDLAALMYLKNVLCNNKEFTNIKHTVIDEAQDLGEFNFYVLKNILKSSTFSIFGDLAQSIYDYRGIENWEDVNSSVFNDKGEIVHFNKSYRTTREIMHVADKVSNSMNLGKSDLVVRSGNEVEITKESKDSIALYIMSKIKEYKDKGFKTIAIISKTDDMSKDINNQLNKLGLPIKNISSSDDLSNDEFNICTISNQLAKGLEFDAVIINDASEDVYSSDSLLDMKLLYVAITRALHELDIIYTGELNKIIDDKKEYVRVRK